MTDTVTDTPRCDCGQALYAVACTRCRGTGKILFGATMKRCPDCGGSGDWFVCPRCDE